MKRLGVAILACILAQPVASESTRAGRAIFEGMPGAPGQVAIGNDRTAAERFPCKSCHRRDGRGGGEGDAPPIMWEALTRPTGSRPSYDPEAFARLLATGETPSGRQISRLMPRYVFERDDVASLIGYLSVVAAVQKTGIHARKIVFGVPIPDDDTSSGLLLVQFLNAALAAKMPANGLHGRDLEIRPLVGDAQTILDEAQNEVVAILSPLPSEKIALSLFIDAGVPVLFPIQTVSYSADPDLLRSLYASQEHVAENLVQRAVADGCKQPEIAATGADKASEILARFLKWHVQDANPPGSAPDCILVAGGHVESHIRDTAKAIYATGDAVIGMPEMLRGFGGTVVVARHETAALELARVRKIGMLTAHATLVAEVLHEALLAAGRDLTRSSLLSSVGSVSRLDLGLSFSQNDSFGSKVVSFQTFAIKDQAAVDKTP